jgi:hypothetical protein
MKAHRWYRLTKGGIGARYAHAYLCNPAEMELEFHCGIGRHADDVIFNVNNPENGTKRKPKCPRCLAYIRNQERGKEGRKQHPSQGG